LNPRSEEDVNVTLVYDFELTGPAATTVPVNFYTNLSYFATTNSQGQGGIQVSSFDVASTFGDSIFSLRTGPNFGPDFNGILSANLLSNVLYSVSISTSGNGATYDFLGNVSPFATGPSWGSASTYFQIDPSFANSSDYTLALSDGILNSPASGTSATPEPATFGLIGLALCGAALLRRR
jgi:hypothetical protein